MASSAKKRTTMAKLNREQKLRERRVEKQMRKDARKRAAAEGVSPADDAQAAPDVADTDAGEL